MRRTGLGICAVAAAVLIAGCGGAASTTTSSLPAPTPNSATVGGWTGVEPDIIYFSGDSGNIVSKITWDWWNGESAGDITRSCGSPT